MSDEPRERLAWRRSRHCADGTCVEVAAARDGRILLRSSVRPDVIVRVTAAEWSAFLAGARRGDFD